MSQRGHVVVSLLAVLAFATHAPAQDRTSRAVVIFIDDLHLSFSSTPSLRRGLVRAIEQLVAAGRMIAMVSDGPSSISQPLTTDRELLLQIANRATGSGVPRDVAVDPTPAEQNEGRKREAVAEKTFEDVISAFQTPRARVIETAQVQLDGILYVTERELKPSDSAVPIIVTRPQGVDAAVADLLSR
jgi:hypothetical protein